MLVAVSVFAALSILTYKAFKLIIQILSFNSQRYLKSFFFLLPFLFAPCAAVAAVAAIRTYMYTTHEVAANDIFSRTPTKKRSGEICIFFLNAL